MVDVSFGQATDPGRLRATNEDAVGWVEAWMAPGAESRGWLFVLADGAGGLDFGDAAARQVVATLVEGFEGSDDGQGVAERLAALIAAANARVHAEAVLHRLRGRRMATTVVACVVRGERAVVAHVGDSRAYLLRDGKIVAATEDHTFENEQRQQGVKTETENADSRKVLTRVLGAAAEVRVEVSEWALEAGDRMLLCSDGVHAAVYDADIVRIVGEGEDAQRAAEELVRYAVEVDGSDNAAVVVVHA